MFKMNRNEKAMLFAEGIVARYKERGNQLPHRSKTCRMDPNRQQEYKDAAKLNDWKQSLKGNRGSCAIEVRDYLDEQIPTWRDVVRTNKIVPKNDGVVVSNETTLSESSGTEFNAPVSAVNMDKITGVGENKNEVTPSTTTDDLTDNTTNSTNPNPISTQPEAYSSMQKAYDIVERYKQRGGTLPRELRDHQNDPIREQEYRDAQKLNKWKQALGGKIGHACSDELRDFLDASMPSWRLELRKNYSDPMKKARDIVERYKSRGNILPRQFRSGNDPLRQQENKDARKLYDWKQALKGLRFYKCSDELKDYLDAEMSGWRQNLKEVHTNPMQKAIDIVERYRANGCLLPRQYKNGTDSQRIQENKDAQKLYNWKEALNGKRGKCSDTIRDYLDAEMPGWRTPSATATMRDRREDEVVSSFGVDMSMDVGMEALEGSGVSSYDSCKEDSYVDGTKRKRFLDDSSILVPCKEGMSSVEDEEEQLRISKQIKKDSELLLQLHGLNSISAI